MQNHPLPSYSRTSALRSSRFTGRNPSAPSIPRTEHHYSLSNSKGVAWVVMKLISRAKSVSHLPAFFEEEPISGVVILDLDKEESIKSVCVTVTGQMTSSTVDVYTFLECSQELWSPAIDAEHQSLSPGDSPPPKSTAKLRGQHEWPFSINLPSTVELKNAMGQFETWRIPPSFSERMARVHIQYSVTVHIRRGMFRVDSQVSTVFGFTPIVKPPPFPEPRRQAYLRGTPLIGPSSDPEGWYRVDPFLVRGIAFSTHMVDCIYNLYLAKPLVYTRGTVIPCFMMIQCNQSQALDLLSMPRVIDVRLTRRISIGLADVSTTAKKTSAYGVPFETTTQYIASAVWWPNTDAIDVYPDQRVLSGEIYLARDMKPSCQVGKFELYYTVSVYPSKAVAFIPDDSAGDCSTPQKVEIVTAYGPGPRPRVYSPSPPNYDDTSSIGQASEFSLFRGM